MYVVVVQGYGLKACNDQVALFRNKKFMLDEKLQGNASKFAIFLEYENPFFLFFISCNFIFSPNECPGLCRHRPGHSGLNIRILFKNPNFS